MNEQDEKESNVQIVPRFKPYIGDDPYIFVAFSPYDKPRVYLEIERLHKKGYRIWYGEGIGPDENWQEQIEKAITKSAYVVAFISQEIKSNANIQYEISYSVLMKKKI